MNPSRSHAVDYLGMAAAPVLCRNHPQFEKRSRNLTAFHLPLRHEVGVRAGGEVVLRDQGKTLRMFRVRRQFYFKI
jgi:hypothetical protein